MLFVGSTSYVVSRIDFLGWLKMTDMNMADHFAGHLQGMKLQDMKRQC